ncbi:hypothetical protein GCM10011361_02530 [Muriicola marianensis]|uniref:ASPIC/UnbV domain-containing protein n=2 Tax=Muriicola marianensis TaxID=1324801 RepID=A0ABQ1QP35_9FLAO|nr:hypothetical protein GCM10011361_02530 [Muriicola marianensis]
MLMFSNFYTGSGVGILDVDNDGLKDIFLGGNQVSSKLYLNKGELQFQDITATAGVETDRWITGISIVDINADGYDDIYLSVSGFISLGKTENLLYINNGDNTFTEMGAEYGLNEKAQTTHTSFFDYDRDGDLDAFMAINPTDFTLFYMNRVKRPSLNGEAKSTDKLYENLGDGTFRDVSLEAGIKIEGYSLGLNTYDFNGDGWTDIYVTNDFITNDILYLNKGDGTFENALKSSFDVTSYASMGNDVADINNDGLPDLFTLDMLPEDNQREKILVNTTNYNFYQMVLKLGYHPQFSRNILQLNNGDGTFSEIGQLAGISRTDWSWSPLFADFDNDGLLDLHVTNGFRRELGNLDYINYNTHSPFVNPGSDIQKQIDEIHKTPGIPLPNYSFRNTGDLSFVNTTNEWGFEKPTYSNGSAVADLDNDGDLDLVINNVDMPAMLYENRSNKNGNHFVKVKLKYEGANPDAVGAKVYLEREGGKQLQTVNPYRGYLSSSDKSLHFGLGDSPGEFRFNIIWPNGEQTYHALNSVDSLQEIEFSIQEPLVDSGSETSETPLFTDITEISGLTYTHREDNHVDFHQQFLLPHQHSKLGPGLAVGDVNNDGYEDCYVGGAKGQPGKLFIQQKGNTFMESAVLFDPQYEDMGCLFLDFDQDGDLDLYVASGGTGAKLGTGSYVDRLYVNDGRGNFTRSEGLIPELDVSTGTVTASDFDKDGDLDLFVGGRIQPGAYPLPTSSYLLVNQNGKFEDKTGEIAPELRDIGMISQGLWTDYDGDEDLDLILVGEWMPITFFQNQNGRLSNQTRALGLTETSGFWNSISASDINQDGRIDYILGNLGANNTYRINSESPLTLIAKDFDENGSVDPLLFKEYVDGIHPVASRDAFLSQLPQMRLKYPNYRSYSRVDQQTLFDDPGIWEGGLELKAYTAHHSYLLNLSNDSLVLDWMPNEAQFAPIFGSLVLDTNRDGKEEVLLTGNLFSNNVVDGPYCSFRGALMEYNPHGIRVTRGNSGNGFLLGGDRKSLGLITLGDGQLAVISCTNDGAVSVLRFNREIEMEKFRPEENKVIISLSNGKKLVREGYYGSGYLSQGSRIVILPENWQKLTFYNPEGGSRTITR